MCLYAILLEEYLIPPTSYSYIKLWVSGTDTSNIANASVRLDVKTTPVVCGHARLLRPRRQVTTAAIVKSRPMAVKVAPMVYDITGIAGSQCVRTCVPRRLSRDRCFGDFRPLPSNRRCPVWVRSGSSADSRWMSAPSHKRT